MVCRISFGQCPAKSKEAANVRNKIKCEFVQSSSMLLIRIQSRIRPLRKSGLKIPHFQKGKMRGRGLGDLPRLMDSFRSNPHSYLGSPSITCSSLLDFFGIRKQLVICLLPSYFSYLKIFKHQLLREIRQLALWINCEVLFVYNCPSSHKQHTISSMSLGIDYDFQLVAPCLFTITERKQELIDNSMNNR